jgi:MFS family permease
VPSAVKDLFKRDLGLTDAQTSLPLSAFVVVYMIASPVFGGLADKVSRKKLIAVGVVIWSLATAAAAFAWDFWSLLAARALVGIGEAAYATIAPALLADFFPPERRNRIFTIFYVATPVGSALGFLIGGLLGEHFGWRAAFLACGLPGVLVAASALFVREPPPGHLDGELDQRVEAPPWNAALVVLAKNRAYVFTVAGYVAVTFATGAITDWFAPFLSRHRGMSLARADLAVGAAAVVGGLAGTILGGVAADRLGRVTKNPYLAVSALSLVPAVVLVWAALYVAESPVAIVACVVIAMVFFMAYNAPINALLVNSVDAGLRVRAFGLSILCIHLFGDVASPPLVGLISDATGDLPGALVIVPLTMIVAAVVWGVGWRVIPASFAERT